MIKPGTGLSCYLPSTREQTSCVRDKFVLLKNRSSKTWPSFAKLGLLYMVMCFEYWRIFVIKLINSLTFAFRTCSFTSVGKEITTSSDILLAALIRLRKLLKASCVDWYFKLLIPMCNKIVFDWLTDFVRNDWASSIV